MELLLFYYKQNKISDGVTCVGAAVAASLNWDEAKLYQIDDIYNELTPLACAYVRARGIDRMFSFGDFVALSETCDLATAKVLFINTIENFKQFEIVSFLQTVKMICFYFKVICRDAVVGIIVPSYTQSALNLLKTKKSSWWTEICIILVPKAYRPELIAVKRINEDDQITKDLIMITLVKHYLPNNSDCYVRDGMIIGVGRKCHAVQQVKNWWMRRHPKILALKFKKNANRVDTTYSIDQYVADTIGVQLPLRQFQSIFDELPELLTIFEQNKWMSGLNNAVAAPAINTKPPLLSSIKKIHDKPKTSRISCIELHDFLHNVLMTDNKLMKWIDNKGGFMFVSKNNMTYEKMCRGLRYHYKTGRMSKIKGTPFGYRFLTGLKNLENI